MDQATQRWTWWLSLLSPFAAVFTRPGGVRFVPWVTGMVLCGEEHTPTQLLTALGLKSRWRVLEHCAEYGAWDREAVERQTLRLLEQQRPARWGRYHAVAIDDTKLHRTSKKVWGTCTFHEASARSPDRAETVRAHHWADMRDVLPGRPWTSRPHAARVYDRQCQLPAGMVVILIHRNISIGPSSAAIRGSSDVETKAVRRPPRGLRLALYHGHLGGVNIALDRGKKDDRAAVRSATVGERNAAKAKKRPGRDAYGFYILVETTGYEKGERGVRASDTMRPRIGGSTRMHRCLFTQMSRGDGERRSSGSAE